jgi:hypothetical protein
MNSARVEMMRDNRGGIVEGHRTSLECPRDIFDGDAEAGAGGRGG